MPRQKSIGTKDSTVTIGFEAKLWLGADKLRNNMDAAEYTRATAANILSALVAELTGTVSRLPANS